MKEPVTVSRKVAVLGFRVVGKSSLTNSFVTGTFFSEYDPTIESTYHKTIRFRKVHFATDIVDTAGMVRLIKKIMLLSTILTLKFTLCAYNCVDTDCNVTRLLFIHTYCTTLGRIFSFITQCVVRCQWLCSCV
jgi:small GTP-binding protein